jgi:hypothetical protein
MENINNQYYFELGGEKGLALPVEKKEKKKKKKEEKEIK